MSKLKKPKSAREKHGSAPQSQVKISSFFQKNALTANIALAPSSTRQNNMVEASDNATHIPSEIATPFVNEPGPFSSPKERLPGATQDNEICCDIDDCIIPDTPENCIITSVSRRTEISFGRSFLTTNIMSELSSIGKESKASIKNTSIVNKNRSRKSVDKNGSRKAVPVNVSEEPNQSSLKRLSDSTTPSSKRSDKKKTPRKLVDSSGIRSTEELLNGNKYVQDDFKEKYPLKKDDLVHRPQSKPDEFIRMPPQSNQTSRKTINLAHNKNSMTNSQNETLDFNADAELQSALKDLSEFNRLDISECRTRRKYKSEELGNISNEKFVVADSQFIADLSPVVSDNKVAFNKPPNNLILESVRSRLTDRMKNEKDRLPLKQINLDVLINESGIKPGISDLDSDALLLSTLKELNENKPGDILRNDKVSIDEQSKGRDAVILTNRDSQFIDDTFECNVNISCHTTKDTCSNAEFKKETEICNSEHKTTSIKTTNAVENVSFSIVDKSSSSVNNSSARHMKCLPTSSISDIERHLQLSSLSIPSNSSSLPTETAINRRISLPTDILKEQTSADYTSRYKPAFHEFGRHTVVGITKYPKETVLDLCAVSDGRSCQCSLSGFWQDTHVFVDDTVNVVGAFDLDSVCRVTDKENFIVVNPDMLISGTTIVSTMRCMRRTVLSQKFKGSDQGNDAMLYGSILHAIFQEALVERATTQADVTRIVELVLTRPEFLHEMYSRNVSEKSVRGEILKYCPEIDAFIANRVRRSDFIPPMSNFKDSSNKSSLPMFIVNVADVEENIWSPRYGVKGKIDLTVEVKLQNERRQWTSSVIPLELKTGKATFSSEHKGQVVLYAMMSEDRRPRSSTSGLLLYLKDLSMQLVADNHAQKRGLIQLRNELAHYVRQSQRYVPGEEQLDDECIKTDWTFGSLPPPINDDFSCTKCPQLLNCSLYQNRLESHHAPLKPQHVMLKLVPESLAHLKATHLDFFSRWCLMLHLETLSSDAEEGVRGLWMKAGQELEALGKCISQLEIVSSESLALGDGKFRQVFRSAEGHFRSRRLCDVGLSEGSSLIVSAENKPYVALTTGLVTSVTEASVTLITDRDLRLYPDHRETVYRLDSCDTYNSMSTSLNNLSRLMENKATCEKLRTLVIDRRAPEFQLTLSKVAINKVKDVFKFLNKPQKAAILKIMMSKDYVLIKGFPGTGKTSTIVALVRILTLLGQSVLLASYTHSAVDNILLKLKQADVDFLRIGRLERVHTDLHGYTAERLQHTVTTVDQLDELYRSKSVVATTCLAMNHAIFTRRKFDVCVVDEATQVLLPACLSCLFVADRFVLVGDPKQLPPIVHNKRAKRLGMDRSLFTHLEDAGGTYSLTLQYRMNAEIMRLSNALTYEGALHCASSDVAEARLKINSSVTCENDWLRRCASNQSGDEVLWLNTDSLVTQSTEEDQNSAVSSNTESAYKKSSPDLRSEVEANIVRSIVRQLMLAGVRADDIGVITPYRQQVLLLRQIINAGGALRDDGMLSSSIVEHVEINTVDQYQGRDKPVIIVSFVKSRDSHNTSEILKDVRRLNVAVTRAKHKLIFVGSVETLSSYEYLRNLITKILTTNQIVAL